MLILVIWIIRIKMFVTDIYQTMQTGVFSDLWLLSLFSLVRLSVSLWHVVLETHIVAGTPTKAALNTLTGVYKSLWICGQILST